LAAYPLAGQHPTLKELLMPRSKRYTIALALLVSAAVSTGCTRTDATGPSEPEQVQPSFESQGSGN
jgi:hypothetical protein